MIHAMVMTSNCAMKLSMLLAQLEILRAGILMHVVCNMCSSYTQDKFVSELAVRG